MWLKGIRLQNIKCFRDTEVVWFSRTRKKGSNRPYRWITLLGENGVGKSTMLQAIGLLLAGPEAAKELLPRPEGWVRDPSKPGKLTAYIVQDEGDEGTYRGEEREWKNFSHSYWVTGSEPVTVSLSGRKRITEETYTEPVLIEETTRLLSWLRTNAFASGNRGWFAAGYGPFRRLTREHRVLLPSMAVPTRSSNFITQFDDDEPISAFERWMVYLDFRIAKDPDDSLAHKMRRIGTEAIVKLLPGKVQVSEVTKDGRILFEIDGQKVPTVGMSDGYRSIIALAGDLVWRLLQTFPDLDDPSKAFGVVLIDELDIHLHPVWQRRIAGWLQQTFPNLQFFVATHSPLVAVGAGNEALTLRFRARQDTEDVCVEGVEDISAYDVDRALKSPAFDLVSTYSPETQQKIVQYHQLNFRFPNLEPEEKRLLAELRGFMQRAQPVNGVPEPGSLEDRMDKYLAERLR
ncbi:MAG: AAA family ATPase [Chloroflexota bacterium]